MAPRLGSIFKLGPRTRLQYKDMLAYTSWGVPAALGALYLIQPFDWLKKQLFEKPESSE